MIDPSVVTDFNRTESELQEFLLFSIVVAGKTAYIQATKLEQFLLPARLKNLTPFQYINYLIDVNLLKEMICDVKLGQYTRLTTAFAQVAKLDLTTTNTDELEKIPGIGPKTSRFFLLHSFPDQQFAVLDTHILAWMSDNVDDLTVPKATPQVPSRYKALEDIFLAEARKRDITPDALDIHIWNERSRKASS